MSAKANSPSFWQNSPISPQNSVSSLLQNSTLETVFCPLPLTGPYSDADEVEAVNRLRESLVGILWGVSRSCGVSRSVWAQSGQQTRHALPSSTGRRESAQMFAHAHAAEDGHYPHLPHPLHDHDRCSYIVYCHEDFTSMPPGLAQRLGSYNTRQVVQQASPPSL